jgi:hypothetical protein
MKFWMPLIVIAFFNCACHHTTAPNNETPSVTARFMLTDTAGFSAAQFHSGESFLLSFALTNNTPDTITYRSGIPIVSFTILKNDSIFTSSYFGCPIPKTSSILIAGYVPPGQTLQSSWKAPTPLCQSIPMVLVSGSYQACVSFPSFSGVKVDSVAPIPFTVIP